MTDPRPIILQHLLPLVPFEGWSEHALRQAALAAGCDINEARRLFAGGPLATIDYFFACEDEALALAHPAIMLANMRIPDRMETLVMGQLHRFGRHREAVRRALAVYALPWNVPRSTRTLYATSDLMWRLAADTSTDFSYYTKRATLAGIYTGALLYWLNDNSENYLGSREFLKRRLANVAAFGKWKRKIKAELQYS